MNKLNIIFNDFILIIYKIETNAFLPLAIDPMTPTYICICHYKKEFKTLEFLDENHLLAS